MRVSFDRLRMTEGKRRTGRADEGSAWGAGWAARDRGAARSVVSRLGNFLVARAVVSVFSILFLKPASSASISSSSERLRHHVSVFAGVGPRTAAAGVGSFCVAAVRERSYRLTCFRLRSLMRSATRRCNAVMPLRGKSSLPICSSFIRGGRAPTVRSTAFSGRWQSKLNSTCFFRWYGGVSGGSLGLRHSRCS